MCGPEESPSRTGQRWWLTATRGDPRESATENTQPMVPTSRFTGNGEMVRQERTAALVTAPAGQTPPPARPSSWLLGPSAVGLPSVDRLGQRVGRLPMRQSRLATVGQDKWPPSAVTGGTQDSA
ncbi:MAG: hypothetical protein AMJ65_01245 [Phycisphaerae bacterium SG8_4]|nr:MAG: hypothetical protein AMJ65_01245 [Phycisphaerae bacterium SG8_4]